MWSLHPKYLDDARLLREHQSIHRLIKTCLSGSAKGRFSDYGGYLAWRHYLCAGEMRRRGRNHNTFLDLIWKQLPERKKRILFQYPRVEVIEDIASIHNRQESASNGKVVRGGMRITDACVDELNNMAREVSRKGLPKGVFLI